jgi:hypothetical protein
LLLRVGQFCVLFALAVSGPQAAYAAQLFIVDTETRNDPRDLFFEPVCNVRLDGPIVTGDAARIAVKLAEFGREPDVGAIDRDGTIDFNPWETLGERVPGYFALCLSSEGGDPREALKLAELFGQFMTVVADGERCVSACAVLFMTASAPRHHTFYFRNDEPGRYLHVNGTLGFHAPTLTLPGDAGDTLPTADIVKAYADALETVRMVMFHDQERGTGAARLFANRSGSQSRIPLDLAMAFVTVPPSEMFEITTIDEALAWGIEPFGFARPDRLTREMATVACWLSERR